MSRDEVSSALPARQLDHVRRVPIALGDEGAAATVRQVVVAAGGMIDRVSAAAGGAPFQLRQLQRERFRVEEVYTALREQGQRF